MARSAITFAVLLFTLALAAPAQAGGPWRSANHNDHGKRMAVCADSLGVRHSPGGNAFAHLRKPQTFLVKDTGPYQFGGEWVYGFAYGNVNAHGWVQNGWFCLGQ
jgi:hypothetical protein